MRALRSLALLPMLAVAAPAQVDHCAQCHEKEAALEHDRAHFRSNVRCVDCHGGDASAATKEKAKAKGTGYRGKLERSSWPELCGSCHANVRRMNPFGIPTDQLAQYRTSRHGEAFFEDGDTTVATCVDCHGSHGILGSRVVESPVYPMNVPHTCSKCHSDPDVVEEHGLEGDEEAKYRKSVHAELLFERDDLSAPQCATCHGNHGAVPPGFNEVGAVCGKCHVRQKELFDQSPHSRLVATGEFGACVACHGHHEVRPAGEYILKRVCALCHEKGDRGLAIRDRLLSELESVERSYDAARKKLEHALHQGLATEDEQLLLENARTALIEMQAQQHALNPEVLEHTAKEADLTLARLSERIDAKISIERLKRMALLPVVLFLGLMSLGFWGRFRRIHRPVTEVHS